LPRPATDFAAVTEKLLVAAEDILRNHGPNRLTVTAIADACGMPQSNVYRFFADKNALFVEIGRRWFCEVEKITRKAAEAGQAPPEAFKSFILGMLRVKCARYDADPAILHWVPPIPKS
jgi:AcrR family transcriptional regulator